LLAAVLSHPVFIGRAAQHHHGLGHVLTSPLALIEHLPAELHLRAKAFGYLVQGLLAALVQYLGMVIGTDDKLLASGLPATVMGHRVGLAVDDERHRL